MWGLVYSVSVSETFLMVLGHYQCQWVKNTCVILTWSRLTRVTAQWISMTFCDRSHNHNACVSFGKTLSVIITNSRIPSLLPVITITVLVIIFWMRVAVISQRGASADFPLWQCLLTGINWESLVNNVVVLACHTWLAQICPVDTKLQICCIYIYIRYLTCHLPITYT